MYKEEPSPLQFSNVSPGQTKQGRYQETHEGVRYEDQRIKKVAKVNESISNGKWFSGGSLTRRSNKIMGIFDILVEYFIVGFLTRRSYKIMWKLHTLEVCGIS